MDPAELQELSPIPLNDLLNMKISGWSIAAAFVFGVIGMWLFKEGRKRHHTQLILISIAMMFYSYFVPGPLTNWTVGIALCALAKVVWNN